MFLKFIAGYVHRNEKGRREASFLINDVVALDDAVAAQLIEDGVAIETKPPKQNQEPAKKK